MGASVLDGVDRVVTPGLSNFDNDERNVVGEGAVPPGSHAVKDCLPHFRQSYVLLNRGPTAKTLRLRAYLPYD